MGDLYYAQVRDGYDTSKLILRNCILKDSKIASYVLPDGGGPYLNNTCFNTYPGFTDSANMDFWTHSYYGESNAGTTANYQSATAAN